MATDASADQIRHAGAAPKVDYRVALAEKSGLEDASVDLVTVAQALHWFNVARFFDETRRVLKPGGVLAYWCYDHCVVAGDSDRVVRAVFAAVESYWPPERKIVEDRYASISMPFEPLHAGSYDMRVSWTAAQMLGYLRTWSAAQRYREQTGDDITAMFASELEAAWGSGRREVRWPITLTLGRR